MTIRALSGIKPTGRPHIGNYLGMLRPIVDQQDRCENFVFIADYHALTSVRDAEAMRRDTFDMALDFLAIGLDPAKSVLYRQSDLPEINELAWILTCVCPMGLLERCTAYKDAKEKEKAVNHGLFAYPVLMAADILAVQSQEVPVGRDQKQHVEVTRDLVNRFHHAFCQKTDPVFTMPEPVIQEQGDIVPGLDGRKMSKSYGNTISIFETPKRARKLINKIVTDSKTVEEPKDPDTCAVFGLYKLFATQEQQDELAAEYRAGGMGYGHAKGKLFDAFDAHIGPMRERREQLAATPDDVEAVLTAGAERARAELRKTLDGVRRAVGLGSK